MALQLAADDLLEEAPVAPVPVSGSVITAWRSSLSRRLEPPVRAAQLEGHVLERHQLHAERGHDRQHRVDHEDVRRRLDARLAHGERRRLTLVIGEAEQDERRQPGADHAALEQDRDMHIDAAPASRTALIRTAGGQHRPAAEGDRRQHRPTRPARSSTFSHGGLT